MRLLTVIFAWLIGPAPTPRYDVSAARSRLRAYSDGKGHFLVMVPFASDNDEKLAFYGDGHTFYHLSPHGYFSDRDGGRFSFDFWDPRISGFNGKSFEHRDSKDILHCEDRTTIFTPLPAKESEALLEKATFLRSRWTRAPYALARDDRGTYYYVDRTDASPGEAEHRDFRLFIGPRGNLKPKSMTNVVSDSEGDIFATREGELRLILDKHDYAWIKGKQRTPLTSLPLGDNLRLIFVELGIYTGQPFGTPCDDL